MPAKKTSFPGTPLIAEAVGPRVWIHGACIIILTTLAYYNSFTVPLLFDDIPAIANNTTIRQWDTTLQPPVASTAGGRPVLNLSLALNYAVSGTAVRSYHLVNLMIHILAGLTLFGLLRRTFAAKPAGIDIAFVAALLWAVHPLQTESVTYIIQRAESLMGLFYLMTLYCFIRGATAADKAARGWFVLAIGACLLGMGTKEVMVSAPLLVLLYDRTFLAGSFREAWSLRSRVYIGLAATWVIVFLLAYLTEGRGGSAGLGTEVSMLNYWLTQPLAILRYLGLSIWPHPLVFYYGTEWVDNVRVILPATVLVATLLGATMWALFRSEPGAKSLGFAGAFFFATLAPTSLVPILLQTSAEHRMYLGVAPVLVLVVFSLFRWSVRAAWPVCGLLAVIFSWLTIQRNDDYRSALTIWEDTVVKVPDNAYAYYNLGYALESTAVRLDDAITHYREAVRIKPDFVDAHTNLGNVLLLQGRTQEAIVQLRLALRYAPDSAKAHNNLGNALAKVTGQLPEAIGLFQEALRRKPNYSEARSNLGGALAAAGRYLEAIAEYEAVLRLDPDNAQAHYNLGNSLARMPGLLPEAISHFQTALKHEPDNVQARNNLGGALVAMGRPAEAITEFEAALRVYPDFADAHYNLATLLGRMPERLGEAITHLQTTVRLKPNFADTRINLGILMCIQGRFEEAISELEHALALAPDSAVARNAFGNALFQSGRMAEAAEQYEKAVNLKPDYAQAHYNRGNALGKLPGQLPDAVSAYETALSLQPEFLEAHFNLAVALIKLSVRRDKTVEHLEAVLRIQPGNQAAQQLLRQLEASP